MRFIFTILFSLVLGIHPCVCFATEQARADELARFDVNCLLEYPKAEPCVIVVFGATGDLTGRKLLPAIYNLAYEGHLSEIAVVGFARGENTHETFRKKMGEAINQSSRTKLRDIAFWNQFQRNIFYHRSEFENDEGYDKLRLFLSQIDKECGTRGNRIYYLATPPSYFPGIIAKLKEHQLIFEAESNGEGPWSRIVIEKPFGNDLHSAIQLQKQISQSLSESQIYRMDHYLGKEGVQNILTFRFGSALFEPMWNHHHIDNIQITLAEEMGIGSRGRLWEETGALRDLLQNHLMQLLAIVAMEPPADLSPHHIHSAKIRLLETIRPFSLLDMERNVVRGQYGPGLIQGAMVIGYREEKGVSEKSSVETFTAIKLFIDNERWKGVPFYIRGGKRLSKQTTEIAITFKNSPLALNGLLNVLIIRVQPNAGIFFKTVSKVPGFDDRLQPIVFGYESDVIFDRSSPEAYERIIFDCIRGNDSLFVKAEEQIAAWRLLTPILDYWRTREPDYFPNYEAGTWGPKAAEQMLRNQGHQWELLD